MSPRDDDVKQLVVFLFHFPIPFCAQPVPASKLFHCPKEKLFLLSWNMESGWLGEAMPVSSYVRKGWGKNTGHKSLF